ncbi:MAG TPA: CxxC-x17-CxxC domain-containing protein [Dehalococcoidia bacterium]|nr:CxxC-x17-CxxC domain-containing protein [Dehalococcoidia bacterium]
MALQEKSLQCADCGASFNFTVEEQEFFAKKGYTNEPRRCPTCREARRGQRSGFGGGGGGSRANRQMYPAVCASCGAETQVPFEPRGDRPVYCSSCYDKNRPAGRR